MLPSGHEPLELADGTLIDPENGKVIVDKKTIVEVPNTTDLKREIVAARKRIADLPVPPKQMNTLSVIISYSLFGITDEDIANTLMIPVEQIKTVKMSDTYSTLHNAFVQNIIDSDLSNVRGMFVKQSHSAASKMFSLLNSESESMQMNAAKDILDRAGQRPVDVVEHRHKLEGGLTIEYVEKKNNIPVIDLDTF